MYDLYVGHRPALSNDQTNMELDPLEATVKRAVKRLATKSRASSSPRHKRSSLRESASSPPEYRRQRVPATPATSVNDNPDFLETPDDIPESSPIFSPAAIEESLHDMERLAVGGTPPLRIRRMANSKFKVEGLELKVILSFASKLPVEERLLLSHWETFAEKTLRFRTANAYRVWATKNLHDYELEECDERCFSQLGVDIFEVYWAYPHHPGVWRCYHKLHVAPEDHETLGSADEIRRRVFGECGLVIPEGFLSSEQDRDELELEQTPRRKRPKRSR